MTEDDEDDQAVEELLGLLQLRPASPVARAVDDHLSAHVPAPRASDPAAGSHDAAVALVAALRRRRERATPSGVGALPGLASAIHRLRVLGRPDEILRDACAEAVGVSGFERVTLSAVLPDGELRFLHAAGTPLGACGRRPGTSGSPVTVAPGSPEAEAVAGREPVTARGPAASGVAHGGAYVVVPILRAGTAVGLFHAAHEPARAVAHHRVSGLAAFAAAFAPVWHCVAVEARWDQRATELSRTVTSAVQTLVGGDESGPASETAVAGDGHDATEASGPLVPASVALTPRERVVLGHVLSGAANREIAEALVLTVETVKTHVKNILRKQGAANRAELISRNHRRTNP